MNLEGFLHNLHFNSGKISPPDWEVDWEDAPLPYKIYRDLPVFPLSQEVPLTLKERQVIVKPDLREIGHFLWYIFGLTQCCQSVDALDSTEQTGLMQWLRRFVPSGGALYPNELYVYLKMEDTPNGVYHYDVAHHQLVLLREGNFDSYLSQSLGNRCDMSACFGTVFVSTIFWKNFFKYHNFSYRLQGLDTGVVIGQLLEVTKRFGFSSGVYFQFLDRAVNHLLGLSEQEESVYAVIPMSLKPETTWRATENDKNGTVSSAELCQELTPIRHNHYTRSEKIKEYPMLVKMNESCLMESTESFLQIEEKEKSINRKEQTLTLPNVKRFSYDFASVCRKRYSPGMDFVLGKISQQQLATLLQEATASFSYHNDLDRGQKNSGYRVSLYGCFYGVEGIPDGAYHYDSATHVLRQKRLGDHRLWIQQGMSLQDVNMFQIPICLHVVGNQDHLKMELGYRGYRIQQIEAGMLVQRLLLVSSAIGLGGHPLLGFSASLCDEIYGITLEEKTSLIQIPISSYRFPHRLQGSLHG
ncbi:SagB family peptide dehydrogenase [Alteribacillus bidgolensis]|uniref:SagB-type dehydrogenase domain-containing protein n=1 Tax=Alteribacillus bidgolensis TaxID=930129 RepID=A0A1G8R9Q7_9BACI|nr:SagB family peptide dehydrogenase [Alteribacillus bidgolensis]SDJ13265.1 SagB-type dehydrogenase domain-containing protein [Alteribacillus bidgolensis]